jgi:DNA-binding transcriptional ArsR family regulator
MVESDAPPLTEIFRALGDATRMQMLGDLATGEKTVSELAQPFAMSLAAASKHIRVLESAGLIEREVRWRTHVCRLKPEPLAEAHRWLGQYERFWTTRLGLLDQILRAEDRAKAVPDPSVVKGQDDERHADD